MAKHKLGDQHVSPFPHYKNLGTFVHISDYPASDFSSNYSAPFYQDFVQLANYASTLNIFLPLMS